MSQELDRVVESSRIWINIVIPPKNVAAEHQTDRQMSRQGNRRLNGSTPYQSHIEGRDKPSVDLESEESELAH